VTIVIILGLVAVSTERNSVLPSTHVPCYVGPGLEYRLIPTVLTEGIVIFLSLAAVTKNILKLDHDQFLLHLVTIHISYTLSACVM